MRAEDRRPEHPLVVIGGHAAFNPEPLADFVDVVVLGEGEEVVGEITEVVGAWIRGGRPIARPCSATSPRSPASTCPSLYDVTYDGPHIAAVTPRYPDVPATVDKRTVADLGEWPYPKRPLVPLTEVVHDRLSVEVFRGCTRGCRFCQAGMITRPVRERPADQVRTMVADGLRRTGYDEVSLTSLSTADFSDVERRRRPASSPTAHAAMPGCSTTVNLPSLRVDAFTVGLAGQVTAGRRSGLTFAPEAGSWRLRTVINKLITEDDLYGAVDAAFEQGWSRVKLYFLTGLPTETDEDTLGIAELARTCVALGQRRAGRASVTASVGGFVPKPHTPFQWFGQNTRAELQRKIDLLRTATAQGRATSTSSGTTRRRRWPRASPAAATAASAGSSSGCGATGGTFQEWGEHFRLERWIEALEAEGLSLDWYVHRHRSRDEILPWSHLTAGLHEDFLWDDWQAALAGSGVEDCRWTPCYDCGVCTGYGIEHVVVVAGAAGRRQPGHRSGPRPRRPAGGGAGRAGDGAGDAGDARRGVGTMKLRVRYAKLGKLRFTSHRDTARMWERAMRKAGAAGRDERRVHAAAAAELRPGPADRGRVDGRVPRRRARPRPLDDEERGDAGRRG